MEIERILDQQNARELSADLRASLSKKYRIDADQAESMLEELLLKDRQLLSLLQDGSSYAKLSRTKVFKSFKKRLSERIYYHLRQYNQHKEKQLELTKALQDCTDLDQAIALFEPLAQTHLSTKERIPDAVEFYKSLDSHLQEAATILDLGCGLHPLMFPYDQYPQLSRYTALERDQTCSEILSLASNFLSGERRRFEFHPWQLHEGWPILQDEIYDLALLFKLVPVIARQDTELLPLLAAVPARKMILTGSMFSMTKNQRIDRRERKVLLRFIEMSGRELLDSFELGEELVYILA